jgi:hypothetical protein
MALAQKITQMLQSGQGRHQGSQLTPVIAVSLNVWSIDNSVIK